MFPSIVDRYAVDIMTVLDERRIYPQAMTASALLASLLLFPFTSVSQPSRVFVASNARAIEKPVGSRQTPARQKDAIMSDLSGAFACGSGKLESDKTLVQSQCFLHVAHPYQLGGIFSNEVTGDQTLICITNVDKSRTFLFDATTQNPVREDSLKSCSARKSYPWIYSVQEIGDEKSSNENFPTASFFGGNDASSLTFVTTPRDDPQFFMQYNNTNPDFSFLLANYVKNCRGRDCQGYDGRSVVLNVVSVDTKTVLFVLGNPDGTTDVLRFSDPLPQKVAVAFGNMLMIPLKLHDNGDCEARGDCDQKFSQEVSALRSNGKVVTLKPWVPSFSPL